MDPLSIGAACASLVAAISKLSFQIYGFVSEVRDARKEMDAVSRELTSLSLCLGTLREDSTKTMFPSTLKHSLVGILRHCDLVVGQMQELLQKMSSGNLGRSMQWSIFGRDEMDRLRSSLEAHKSAIDIAVDVYAVLLVNDIQKDVKDIKNDAAEVKQNARHIASLVQEIGLLRLQVSQLEHRDGHGSVILRRFMEESMTYAESVVDSKDLPVSASSDCFSYPGFEEEREYHNPDPFALEPDSSMPKSEIKHPQPIDERLEGFKMKRSVPQKPDQSRIRAASTVNTQLSPSTANTHYTASDVCKIIITITLPPLAVFLERGCGGDLLLNILLTTLGYIPGIIQALYILLKY